MSSKWGHAVPQRAKARNQFWAVAAGGGAAIAALTATLHLMAADYDRLAVDREQTVVNNGIQSRAAEVGQQVVPQAVWDDAVVNLDNRFDRAWAHDNVGTYLHVTNGFAFSWVLDARDRPIYGMSDGEDAALGDYDRLAGPAARIVSEVRRKEADRSAHRANPGAEPEAAIVANASDVIGNDLIILSATLVQPDFGSARIKAGRAPIILTGRVVDPAFVESFGQRYMLADAHLHHDDTRLEPDQAHAGITNSAGRTVATLDWTPQQPGSRLLDKFLPIVLAILAGLLAVALVAYRKNHAATKAVVASEARALHIAYHDALTGLGNRRAMDGRLSEAFTAVATGGSGYALYSIDLDNFKELNDISGHAVGDELLKTVARRLRRIAGQQGLCYRMAGDEFALIQFETDPNQIGHRAERTLKILARPYALSIGRFQLTATIGVAVADAADADAGEALRKADLALFAAKRDGRGRFALYEPAMDEALRRRRGLVDALRRDIQAGTLSMVYQPQVDRNRSMIGVEALVRWTSADFGPVSPAVFVPLAEESGLIESLSAFTLSQAFRDSLRWPDLKMAVNISALQLKDPTFTDRILALASDTGVSPSGIELELTEGILVDRGQGASARLDALREAGFSIAIDDFGTGYSSLSYLSRFPIGKIKIDRSFVIDMGQSRSADVLVKSIVQLGRSLNMRVIAEGVETSDQWLRLAAVGCTEFQGYIASRPVPAEDIDRLYAGERIQVAGQDPDYAPEHHRVAA